MMESYILTVIWYGGGTFKLLSFITHAQEFLKVRVKSKYGKLSGELISEFYDSNHVPGISAIRTVRDAYARHLQDVKVVHSVLSSIDVCDVKSVAMYFGVDLSVAEIRTELCKLKRYVEELCM